MQAQRKELGCECYGGLDVNGSEMNCGDPVVALWDWGGIDGKLYVCEKHDDEIIRAEEDDEEVSNGEQTQ